MTKVRPQCSGLASFWPARRVGLSFASTGRPLGPSGHFAPPRLCAASQRPVDTVRAQKATKRRPKRRPKRAVTPVSGSRPSLLLASVQGERGGFVARASEKSKRPESAARGRPLASLAQARRSCYLVANSPVCVCVTEFPVCGPRTVVGECREARMCARMRASDTGHNWCRTGPEFMHI